MKLHHVFDSLRTKIILLVLLSLLPSCILIFYASQHESSRLRSAVFHDAFTLAKNLSDQQEDLIDDARRTLFSVSQVFESIEPKRIDSQKILNEFQEQNPQLISVFIANQDGEVIASSTYFPKGFTIADRPIYHVVTQQKAFAIGEYQMARIAGKPILSMAYPILGDNGQIKTIYVTGLDLTRLDQFISTSELPRGTLLTIIDRNGTLLYHYPNAPNRIGKKTGNLRSAREIVNRQEGTLEIVDEDGVERLYGFSTFGRPKGSVFIAVAIPKKEAFAELDKVIYHQIIWFGIVLFLALSAAWTVSSHVIIKPLNNIVHAAQLIAGGNLTYRIDDKGGQGEIHSLSRSFNQMAEALRRRLEERGKAEEQLQRILDSLRKAVNTTIQVLVSAVETRDPYTAGHQIRSANLARAIATEMGLPPEKIESIRMAGSIHDIGKLSIPAEILTKPTRLSELEFLMIKEHARRGFEMLKDVESPWPLAEMVYQHHERMDGSGYPRNLKGEEILMEARILAVSDVVESMASHRPYRPGLGIHAALEEIEKNSGIYYDNAVAGACLRLFREKGFQLEGT